jgi:hypothetical protein
MLDPIRAGRGTRAAIALLACWGFGAANELFEFLSSLRFADAYVGGLENAGWDLAFNTAGSAIAAVCCWAWSRPHIPPAFSVTSPELFG